MRPGSRRWAAKVALACVGTLVALGVGELALRVVAYYPMLTDRNMYVAGDSPLLPHRLRPNYRGSYLGKVVTVDAGGYRTVVPEVTVGGTRDRDGALKTVLLIGDSLVFGHGLANDETPADARTWEKYFDDAAMDYSMEALKKIEATCRERRMACSVGIYRDIWHYGAPDASRRYEEKLESRLISAGIRFFVIKSHIEKMPAGQTRIRWNDPHPSPRAVLLIVEDLAREVATRFGEPSVNGRVR